LKFHNLLLGTLVSSIISCNVVANSFGVPERPSNTSPSSSEVGVTTLPTLTSSDFVIKNDAGAVQANTVLTESEWLVYENTGVTLVGGGNLTGSDRDNGDTVYFDVSSSNVSLAGSVVYYAYVNHKRLELTGSSGGLLGYVELPDFIWQADDKDPYLATRFKQSDGAVVIEWTYGDASAATPWELTLQAVLNDGLIGLKIKEDTFTADFVTAYGSEQIGLCDEASCFGHDFTTIYNTGNAITCSLVLESDTCSGAALESGAPLSDMSITEIEIGTSSDTSYSLSTVLSHDTEYTWAVRHKGTLDAGSEILGGWSNASQFVTEETGAIAQYTTAELEVLDDVVYLLSTSVNLKINNTSGTDLENVQVYVQAYNTTLESIPESCQLQEGYDSNTFICNISNFAAGDQISYSLELPVTDKYNSPYLDTVVSNIDFYESSFEGLGDASNLQDILGYELSLLGNQDNFGLLDSADVIVQITNRGNYALNSDFYLHVSWSGSEIKSDQSDCTSTVDENNGDWPLLICKISPVAEDNILQIPLILLNQYETDVSHSLTISLCSESECTFEQIIYSISPSVNFQTSASEDSGGSLWLLPLLGLFLRRK
jgi:hypothetical protein